MKRAVHSFHFFTLIPFHLILNKEAHQRTHDSEVTARKGEDRMREDTHESRSFVRLGK